MTEAEARLEGLMRDVVTRSPQALADLYEVTVARLYGIARAILGSREDAEDVVCNVFIHAWNHAPSYDRRRGGVMGWLAVITHSRSLDLLRRRRDHVSLDETGCMDSVSMSCDRETPDGFVDKLQRDGLVSRALAELSAVQRQLIALAFMQGLCHAEIATATGLPIGTVKSHIRRALKRMQTLLNGPLEAVPVTGSVKRAAPCRAASLPA